MTRALNDWIRDTVGDTSVVRFRADACYRVEGTITIEGKSGIVVEGHGARLRADAAGGGEAARNRSTLSIKRASNVVVRDLEVRGPNRPFRPFTDTARLRALQGQHGIHLTAASNVLIENVDVSGVRGDCVYVGGMRAVGPSRNVVVRTSTLSDCGRQGVAVTDARDVLVDGNEFGDTGMFSVDVEPNRGRAARRVAIAENRLGPSHWQAPTLLGIFGFPEGSDIRDVTIAGNTVPDTPFTYFLGANNDGRYTIDVELGAGDRARMGDRIWNPDDAVEFVPDVAEPRIHLPPHA